MCFECVLKITICGMSNKILFIFAYIHLKSVEDKRHLARTL
ncbi:MAG: hypothetical protein K0R59_326 [Sphingobacterium sp.]|jgi:hypothetical protein|nr:hypothetical protein [Sphingobacterium sp.]